MTSFNFKSVDPSWQDCLNNALKKIDPHYLAKLYHTSEWLPGQEKIFNAFSLPVNQVNYVLFGESPYPRTQSANGFAFWDAAVTQIWSETGLSKQVNRATSLRNIIKMLLVSANTLPPDHTTQSDIAQLNKTHLIQTNQELFNNFLSHGFLLLNASLVLQSTPVRKDAAHWYPFMQHVLSFLLQQQPQVEFILLGKIANVIDQLIPQPSLKKLYAEHPYNYSFINNPKILAFFKPLNLLKTNMRTILCHLDYKAI